MIIFNTNPKYNYTHWSTCQKKKKSNTMKYSKYSKIGMQDWMVKITLVDSVRQRVNNFTNREIVKKYISFY